MAHPETDEGLNYLPKNNNSKVAVDFSMHVWAVRL